jgi:S1-C subfamily serine protease
MTHIPLRRSTALALVVGLAVSCSSQTSDQVSPLTLPASDTTAAPATTMSPTPTTLVPVEPGSVVERLQDVWAATVRVVPKAEFVHPDRVDLLRASSEAGVGSGFAIDADGHVVTGSQVVQGASEVDVWVLGEDEPRIATVKAVDECAGLAVLQVQGEPLPYLQWYDEDRVRRGTQLYASGFSEETGGYMLLDGGIQFEESRFATSWAAAWLNVSYGVEHRPGLAGGPMVNEQGRIVGITSPLDTGANSFMATAMFAGAALPVVERLLDGQSFGIGVNAQAVSSDTGFSGMWVAGVAPESLAEASGIAPGDIIHGLDGNLTIADYRLRSAENYCNIIDSLAEKTAGAGITIVRHETGERLEGVLGKELKVADAGPDHAGAPFWWGSDALTAKPKGFVERRANWWLDDGKLLGPKDELDNIHIDVPYTWFDKRVAPVVVDQRSASSLLMSTGVNKFDGQDRSVPAVRVFVSGEYRMDRYELDALLDVAVTRAKLGDCTELERVDLTELGFLGPVVALREAVLDPRQVKSGERIGLAARAARFENCGDRDTSYTIVAGYLPGTKTKPDGAGYTVEIQTVHSVGHNIVDPLLGQIVIVGWP